jgi:hypothetical protein
MFQTKVVENIKTHILHSVAFYEYRAVCKIMRKNSAGPDRPKIIRRMHVACWINMAANTHSEYVILIAFPLQQWLHEHTSMLRYTYLNRLVYIQASIILTAF